MIQAILLIPAKRSIRKNSIVFDEFNFSCEWVKKEIRRDK